MVTENSGFEKAQILNLDNTEEKVDCMFRPKELSLNKTNTWSEKPVKEGDVPALEFGGGKPAELKMQLFFDTYQTGEDVRKKYTNKVWKLMDVITAKGGEKRPPYCQFTWGNYLSFKAVITSISQEFTLFLSNGTPVRSTLNVSFRQSVDEKKKPRQNPTTASKPGYRTRQVMPGETLDWIAFEEYGDPHRWRFLADINNLDDPMSLKEGLVLAIAPLD
jgi:hypothetical protein